MSQDRLDDLYDRLTSRKLWLALLSIAFAFWNYAEGRLSATDFQVAIFGAVTAYSVAEGVTDAAAAWHTSPDSIVRTTVNTTTAPEPATTPPVAATRARRVRPSRAKVKTDG